MNLKTSLITSIFLLEIVCTAAARTIYVDDDGPVDFNNILTGKNDAKCILFGMGGDGKCSLWFATSIFPTVKCERKMIDLGC